MRSSQIKSMPTERIYYITIKKGEKNMLLSFYRHNKKLCVTIYTQRTESIITVNRYLNMNELNQIHCNLQCSAIFTKQNRS